MYQITTARFLRKPTNLQELLYERELTWELPFSTTFSSPTPVYIAEEKTLSKEEWDSFTGNFLSDTDFINNFSDTCYEIKKDAWPVLRVKCPDTAISLLIDPQGYSYARYVAIEEKDFQSGPQSTHCP